MRPNTPTLPTVIITPSTPIYPLPSRTTYTYTPTPITSSSSSTRNSLPFTRKQHLVSALKLGPSLFPKSESETYDEKPDQTLLLPSHVGANTHQSRRLTKGLLLSLLVLGTFGLILVGPMIPYRWYAGKSGAETPVRGGEGHAWDSLTPPPIAEEAATADLTGIAKRWDLYAYKQHHGESGRDEETVEPHSWRYAVQHGLDWAMLD